MAKFCGKIGFTNSVETAPGVWVDKVEEKTYRGDVLTNYFKWQNSEQVNDDLYISSRISILADYFAYENLANIKYVEWYGARWKVLNVEPQRPRIILTLGGVYSGEVPTCCEEESC